MDDDVKRGITRLGLQRNMLTHVSLEWLQTFPQLARVDLSEQKFSPDGCVMLDFDPADQPFEVTGEFPFTNIFCIKRIYCNSFSRRANLIIQMNKRVPRAKRLRARY